MLLTAPKKQDRVAFSRGWGGLVPLHKVVQSANGAIDGAGEAEGTWPYDTLKTVAGIPGGNVKRTVPMLVDQAGCEKSAVPSLLQGVAIMVSE